MRGFLLLHFFLVCSAIPPQAAFGQAAGKGPVQLQARFLKFTSFCDFQDPGGGPAKEVFKAGTSLEASGCGDLEKTLASPKAVLITMRNAGSAPLDAIIDGFSSVVLIRKDGSRAHPVAMGLKQSTSFGPTYSFVTAFTGTWVPVIDAGQSVNLTFFFSKADAGDSVSIARLGVARIQ